MIKWWRLTQEALAAQLATDPAAGLAAEEAARRLAATGPNRLQEGKGRTAVGIFFEQFADFMIWVLIAAALVSGFLKEWVDAIAIIAIVVLNAILGFIQEHRAERSLQALRRMAAPMARAVRGGTHIHLPAGDLVPGDLVELEAGDNIPADARIIGHTANFAVQEAGLTGESTPVLKSLAALDRDDVPLGDRANLVFMGTSAVAGKARAVVVETGMRTELGKIAGMIQGIGRETTPLQKRLEQFGKFIIVACFVLVGLVFLMGLLRGGQVVDLFLTSVSLAVAAIPEGLPAVVTIALAMGVQRMVKRNCLIRKLPAVETLGSTTVICSDKTGTLTENQMTVQGVSAGGVGYEVSGTGYNPEGGGFAVSGQPVASETAPALDECLRAGVLCNDSRLVVEEGNWQVHGDPTEGALLAAGLKAGLEPKALLGETPRLDSIPFESEYQYMATLHRAGGGRPCTVYLKGAVETILARCADSLDAAGGTAPLQPERIYAEVEALAAGGARVLAFARKELGEEPAGVAHEDVASGLTFLGLQGMIDPPREAAVAAVKTCQAAGVRVKMITGDHPLTAAAIARQVGLAGTGGEGKVPVLTGRDLAELSDRELIEAAERTPVFARATPEQKLRLVEALQARGHVVAMTGDGVNDAPALKKADIGVAMGITGTEVAKEAADMVLTDDNFSSIEAAVEEGRGVFDNLTKFIVWTLPTNLGEGLVILLAIFLGVTLPILPVQILWINMTTAGFLGLMLAFEPKEPGIMRRPPRDPQTPILTRTLSARILLVGTLLLLAAFGLFEWELRSGASLEQARTVAVNAFVIVELFYLFNCRSLRQTIFELGFFTNLWVFGGVAAMLLLQVAYTYVPFMNRLFQAAPIGPLAWLKIMAAGFVTYLIVEGEKRLWQRAGGTS